MTSTKMPRPQSRSSPFERGWPIQYSLLWACKHIMRAGEKTKGGGGLNLESGLRPEKRGLTNVYYGSRSKIRLKSVGFCSFRQSAKSAHRLSLNCKDIGQSNQHDPFQLAFDLIPEKQPAEG